MKLMTMRLTVNDFYYADRECQTDKDNNTVLCGQNPINKPQKIKLNNSIEWLD